MRVKRLLSILLCTVLILCLIPAVFAEDEEELTDIEEYEKMTYREDGLPDIDLHSWKYILANQNNSCGVYISHQVSPLFIEQGIDSRIHDDAVSLVQACQAAGNPCYINSGNRTWEFLLMRAQERLKYEFDGNSNLMAQNVLCPGCNEHQTGLSFDITADPSYINNYDDEIDDWTKDSPTWEWMKENCADYGFIIRYPEGKEQYYGISCHADTHLRYVGRIAAKYMAENNLCFEEFLMKYGYPVKLPSAK